MTSFSAVESQPQTITWDHTDPKAWTFERVMFWLQVHNFGPEWKRVFKENDIKHHKFLSLSNYRNLKALGLTDSVTRFIRLARAFEKPQGYNWLDQEKTDREYERTEKERLHKRSESATTTSSYWSNSDTRCSPSVISFSHRSFEKYMFLSDNLRPRRQPITGKHAAITTDHTTFSLVPIADCNDVEDVLETFKSGCNAGPGCSITVHLTEYFCIPGEALSNRQLWNVLSAAAGDIVKFFINVEIKSPLLEVDADSSKTSNSNTSGISMSPLSATRPKRRVSPAVSHLSLQEDSQISPLSVGTLENESVKSSYSDNAGSPDAGKNMYPDTPSYLISSVENTEVDYFNIRPSRLSLITETDNSAEPGSFRGSNSIVSPYRSLEARSRESRRTISSPTTETSSEGLSNSQRRSVSGPATRTVNTLTSTASTKSTTSTASTTSTYQPSKFMQKSTAALLARDREGSEDTKRHLPRLKVNTKQDFQNPAFKLLRETGNKEINFDKPRLSPYEDTPSNGLTPRRNAPPPPLARQASSKYRPELSPNGLTMEDRRPMIRSTSERRIPSRLPSLQRIPPPVPAAESTQISWDDVPEVSDEESDGDDDLWAIQPDQSTLDRSIEDDCFNDSTQSSANNTKLSERVARPSTEDVYDNLEQFFPNADLDKPVIIANKPEPPQDVTVTAKPPERTGITRMKSIRVVASEASHRIKSNRAVPAQSRPILRRKSTKMWGQKVVEMGRSNPITLRDQKQYMWIKGELIGKGTFGKVYLGFNVTTGDVMAVKQVRTVTRRAAQEQKGSEGVDNLFREVENMKDLDHPNIVQYLGFEVKGDSSNLFLEYVPGGSVKSIIAQYGRFQEEIIQHLSRQVLEGLTYLHSRGILHRDLKADNLLLDIDGTAKISDFGISKRSRDIYSNNAEMSMQGTIFWMAPEVIRNVVENERQGYSAKVDIWSFGCVVLEMFAGRRPWSTEEAIGAMYKLGSNKMAPPIPDDTRPFMSENGVNFLQQCFIIDPSRRPTADVLLDDEFTLMDAGFRFQNTTLGQKLAAQASVTMPFAKHTTE